MMMMIKKRVIGQFSNNDRVDKASEGGGIEGKAGRTKASKNGEIKRV